MLVFWQTGNLTNSQKLEIAVIDFAVLWKRRGCGLARVERAWAIIVFKWHILEQKLPRRRKSSRFIAQKHGQGESGCILTTEPNIKIWPRNSEIHIFSKARWISDMSDSWFSKKSTQISTCIQTYARWRWYFYHSRPSFEMSSLDVFGLKIDNSQSCCPL